MRTVAFARLLEPILISVRGHCPEQDAPDIVIDLDLNGKVRLAAVPGPTIDLVRPKQEDGA
jgi:hypothetical protein